MQYLVLVDQLVMKIELEVNNFLMTNQAFFQIFFFFLRSLIIFFNFFLGNIVVLVFSPLFCLLSFQMFFYFVVLYRMLTFYHYVSLGCVKVQNSFVPSSVFHFLLIHFLIYLVLFLFHAISFSSQ